MAKCHAITSNDFLWLSGMKIYETHLNDTASEPEWNDMKRCKAILNWNTNVEYMSYKWHTLHQYVRFIKLGHITCPYVSWDCAWAKPATVLKDSKGLWRLKFWQMLCECALNALSFLRWAFWDFRLSRVAMRSSRLRCPSCRCCWGSRCPWSRNKAYEFTIKNISKSNSKPCNLF